jgi:CheY-like chemotaxis protein
VSVAEGPQLNILVIDDDESMRGLLVDVITRREHQAVPVGSAEEGLALLPHWTFHIAFLDHNLPGMEGLVFGEYLRRNNPDMTIVMVTGSDDRRVERKSRDLSLAFIPKPFKVADIQRIMDEYLEGATQREEQRKSREDRDYGPPISTFFRDLPETFAIPSVPNRIHDRLVETLKRSLNNLRSAARYTERERVVVLSGLLTARVLGVDLPRTTSGTTLYEEYDRLMRERGRRTEFDADRPRSSSPPPADEEE